MPKKKLPDTTQGGAYIIHLNIKNPVILQAGSLKDVDLPTGHYVYVGSARKSISGRINRHRRLAESKEGKLHWHIDYVLVHPDVEWVRADSYAGYEECNIARQVELMKGASVPVLHFGASDCRSRCKAHLFRVRKFRKNRITRTEAVCEAPDRWHNR